MRILNVHDYKCSFQAKCIPCDDVPTDCLHESESNLVGLSKEMVLMTWLQKAFDDFISINCINIKGKNEEYVETLEAFLSSPDVLLKFSDNNDELILKAEIRNDERYWYEFKISELTKKNPE